MEEDRAWSLDDGSGASARRGMPAGQRGAVRRRASSAEIRQPATIMTIASISLGSALNLEAGERQGLAATAAQASNATKSDELRNLAWAVIQNATKGIEEAGAAAQLCLRYTERPNFIPFLEQLQTNCIIIYRNRHHLMRESEPTAAPRGWTAYVFFLAELVHGLARWSGVVSAPASSAPAVDLVAQNLGKLVCYCGLVILRAPSLGHPAEVECLRSVLATAGVSMQRLSPEAMATLRGRLRQAALQPNLSRNSRQTLADMLSTMGRLEDST
ncbi:uncharacterized protein LOC144156218 isoform X2 [Haemaphysalis longicornis]